jgi:hypothetical protein
MEMITSKTYSRSSLLRWTTAVGVGTARDVDALRTHLKYISSAGLASLPQELYVILAVTIDGIWK